MTGESLKVSRAFLQPPEKVETILVSLGVVVHVDLGGLFVRYLGELISLRCGFSEGFTHAA
jgi:hypothetical protein